MREESQQTGWRSFLEAASFAGLTSTILQTLDLSAPQVVAAYVILLITIGATIFNVRALRRKPLFDYIDGRDESFEYITRYVKAAKHSISVTRFSRGGIVDETDYFKWTMRRILGERCAPIPHYRRVMNIDSRDKAELMCQLLREAGKSTNFYLRTTKLRLFFEVLVIDNEHGFFLFHAPDGLGSIDAVLRISEPQIVRRIEGIYEAVWRDPSNSIVKASSLTEEEINGLVDHFGTLARSLSSSSVTMTPNPVAAQDG